MANKKIIGATAKSFNNIQFKSKLEVTIYKELLIAGFKPKYEEIRYILIEGFKPTVPFYTYKNKENVLDVGKIRDITYTPDFTFEHNGYTIVIECKGYQNDVYPYKRKLFRRYIEGKKFLFFEIYTKKQLLQAISVIKQCKQSTESESCYQPCQPKTSLMEKGSSNKETLNP